MITAIPTAISITGTPNPANIGQTVTLKATVSSQAPSQKIDGGSISFYDGSTLLGSTQVTSSGVASLAASFSSAGVHDITAVYSGDTTFSASTSSVFAETIVAGDFEINVTPGSVSVYPGNTAKTKVYVTSLGGFSEQLALSCTGLPAETSCLFSPVSLTNGQGEAALVIQTTFPHRVQASAAAGIARIPGVLAFVIMLGWRRRRGLLAKMLAVFLAANLLFAAAGMLAGCGSPGAVTGGTPPGVYQVAVTATTTGSGTALTHSAPLTLTVKSY